MDGLDEFLEVGVDGGFSAADDDDGAGPEVFGLVDDVEDLFEGHLVFLGFTAFSVAVFAAEVAAQARLEAEGQESAAVSGRPCLLVAVEIAFKDTGMA